MNLPDLLFSAIDSEGEIADTDVMVIRLDSGGLYIYKTDVTVTATVCGRSTNKTFHLGNELGNTQIQITLVGDLVAM